MCAHVGVHHLCAVMQSELCVCGVTQNKGAWKLYKPEAAD